MLAGARVCSRVGASVATVTRAGVAMAGSEATTPLACSLVVRPVERQARCHARRAREEHGQHQAVAHLPCTGGTSCLVRCMLP